MDKRLQLMMTLYNIINLARTASKNAAQQLIRGAFL